MLSLSIHHLLEVYENHLALNNASTADLRFYFTESQLSVGTSYGEYSFRNLEHADRFGQPLTQWEEQRFKTLDRKAKGSFLSEQEDREFERLLEIKRYYSIKHIQPSLSHPEVLARLRA